MITIIAGMTGRQFTARMKAELGIADAELEDLGAGYLMPTGHLADGSGVAVSSYDGYLPDPDLPMDSGRDRSESAEYGPAAVNPDCDYRRVSPVRYESAAYNARSWPDGDGLDFNDPLDIGPFGTPAAAFDLVAWWQTEAVAGQVFRIWCEAGSPDSRERSRLAAAAVARRIDALSVPAGLLAAAARTAAARGHEVCAPEWHSFDPGDTHYEGALTERGWLACNDCGRRVFHCAADGGYHHLGADAEPCFLVGDRGWDVAAPGTDPRHPYEGPRAPEVCPYDGDKVRYGRCRGFESALGPSARRAEPLPGEPEYIRVTPSPEMRAAVLAAARLGDEAGGISAQTRDPEPADLPGSIEWCIWWGGEDPNDCAGFLTYDDEAECIEMAQWIKAGRVARRAVTRGPWQEAALGGQRERDDGVAGDAIGQIAELLDGREWDAGTAAQIADIIRRTGRQVRDPAGTDTPRQESR